MSCYDFSAEKANNIHCLTPYPQCPLYTISLHPWDLDLHSLSAVQDKLWHHPDQNIPAMPSPRSLYRSIVPASIPAQFLCSLDRCCCNFLYIRRKMRGCCERKKRSEGKNTYANDINAKASCIICIPITYHGIANVDLINISIQSAQVDSPTIN